MKRRLFITSALSLSVMAALPSFGASKTNATNKNLPDWDQWQLSEKEWKATLSEMQFDVLRKEKTESPFSNSLNKESREGVFACSACELPLFSSEAKYDSGTGWPSFFQPIDKDNLGIKKDYKLIYPRTEYHCARCGGHQGHIFKDGPQPTGLRYCNNGVALKFIPKTS